MPIREKKSNFVNYTVRKSKRRAANNITEFTIKAMLIKYNIIKTKSIKIAITTNHICFNMSITSSHKNYSYLDNITHQL